jgi:hypothetical protein
MFVKSLAESCVRLGWAEDRIEKGFGVPSAERHGLMFPDRFFGVFQGTGQNEFTDRFTFNGSRLFQPSLGGAIEPKVNPFALA